MDDKADKFADALLDIAANVEGELVEQVFKKGVFDLYGSIIKRTPVDTGRARGNWQISFTHNDDEVEGLDKSEKVISEANEKNVEQLESFENEIEKNKLPRGGFSFEFPDNAIYLFNNLEYIEFLEDGTSDQAPNGMVELSLVEFTEHLRNIEI